MQKQIWTSRGHIGLRPSIELQGYLGFVWLCGFNEVIVSCLLLLVSLHAERLVIFPQMRTWACCVTT